MLRKNNYITIY